MTTMLEFGRSMVLRAQQRADAMGTLRNSVTGGAGNLWGFIGEEALKEWMRRKGVELRHADTYDFDFVATTTGDRIEVKTKQRGCWPRPHFDNTVTCHNDTQDCDLYVFLQIQWVIPGWKGVCYFCGAVEAKTFRAVTEVQEAGVARGSNGFIPKARQRYLAISKCGDATEFLCRLRAPLP